MPKRKLILTSDFVAPKELACKDFFFTVLEPSLSEIDYEIVMGSKERLRHVFFENDSWPADDMTLIENTNDLVRHNNEFHQKIAFAYSVMSPNKERYIGCIYINPTSNPNYDCEVYLWVSDKALAQDKLLYKYTRGWLKEDWPFKNAAYPGREIPWKDWK